jgi:KUP system potassium uptake protein
MREGRVPVRRFINRMIDERPDRVPGTAVFLTPSLETVPTALLRNTEHNGVLHERVVLLRLAAVGVPHVDHAQRLQIERMRLGFIGITARYGYQDDPDVVAVMRLAVAQEPGIDPDSASYFVDHVSILPSGRSKMAGWRKRLFVLLHQNALPPARYLRVPPDRVFEVGGYVEL